MPPVAWGFTFTNLEIVFKKTVSLKKKKKGREKRRENQNKKNQGCGCGLQQAPSALTLAMHKYKSLLGDVLWGAAGRPGAQSREERGEPGEGGATG